MPQTEKETDDWKVLNFAREIHLETLYFSYSSKVK